MQTQIRISITIMIFVVLSCTGFKTISSSKIIQYSRWQNSILAHYDSLASKDLKYKESRKGEFHQIKDVLDEIDSTEFQKMLTSALSQNELKDWNSMYYVFWYQEGEIANTIVTFIFYSVENRSWSISYLPYQDYKLAKAGYIAESDLNQKDEELNLYYGEFFTISKFDSDFNCLSNTIFLTSTRFYPKIDSLLFPE